MDYQTVNNPLKKLDFSDPDNLDIVTVYDCVESPENWYLIKHPGSLLGGFSNCSNGAYATLVRSTYDPDMEIYSTRHFHCYSIEDAYSPSLNDIDKSSTRVFDYHQYALPRTATSECLVKRRFFLEDTFYFHKVDLRIEIAEALKAYQVPNGMKISKIYLQTWIRHLLFAACVDGININIEDEGCILILEKYFSRSWDSLKDHVTFSRMHGLDIDDHKSTKNNCLSLPYYRIAGDRDVIYGDGECKLLCFPVYVCPEIARLGFSQEDSTRLKNLLVQLAKTRKDKHEDEPRIDIIDPSLNPILLNTDPQKGVPEGLYLYQLLQNHIYGAHASISNYYSTKAIQLGREIGVELERDSKGKPIMPKFTQNVDEINNINPGLRSRAAYQWSPSTFSIDENGISTICTPIPQAPDRKTEQGKDLYTSLEKLFTSLVPMFRTLGVVPWNNTTKLQVITKVQMYGIQPETSYSGHWHLEGMPENIVAVGTYYLSGSEKMIGGNLKFRPESAPQPYYQITTDAEHPTHEGHAFVFANTIPHRLRRLYNPSKKVCTRLFVTFFVVDPNRPIITPSKPSQMTETQAKEFRAKTRAEMKHAKSGWGHINYGNCGNVEFCPGKDSFWISPCYTNAEEELYHTDSSNQG